MGGIVVLPSALKYGLTEQSLRYAWENFVCKRPRGDDCWVAVGFDAHGIEIEMVGLVTADDTILLIHGMSPATEKIKRELGLGRQ